MMLGFFSRRFQSLLSNRSNVVVGSLNHAGFTRLYSSESSLGNTQHDKDWPFTVSYLVHSCGLSPQVALSLFNKRRIEFESPEKPDSVLELFKDYGFGDTHISVIVKTVPELLMRNARSVLLPKLKFFHSVGIRGTTLAEVISSNPSLLASSLNNSIKPCYDIVTTNLGIPQGEVPRFMIRAYTMFNFRTLRNVARNLSYLRSVNVPESTLDLYRRATIASLQGDTYVFNKNVKKAISMGFPPSSRTFMKALYVVTVKNDSQLAQNMEFYKMWGWTENDLLLAFKKFPLFVCYTEKSQKTLSAKLDFFMNVMGCQPSDIAQCPVFLTYSLENRIIPRCSVIRVLQLQGLITKKDVSIYTVLQKREEWFLDSFVMKYQEQVPELLRIARGEMDLAELGLGFVKRYEMESLKQEQHCDY